MYSVACLGLMMAGASGCGAGSDGGVRSRRAPAKQVLILPVQDDALLLELVLALSQVEATIDLAEGVVLTIHVEPSPHAELRSAIDSARAELARLRDACDAQNARGAASCLDEPSPAVATAGHALGQSLDELGQILAFKRRIIPPEDPDKGRSCTPQPVCPHMGGDAHHDECADREPPNILPGCDVLVYGKHFDALAAERVLWEVKTHAWSGYSPFLRELTYRAFRAEAEAEVEAKIAHSCGFKFVFAVADAELHDKLSEELREIDVRYVPRCQRGKTSHAPK